jgi:hypothetical protein
VTLLTEVSAIRDPSRATSLDRRHQTTKGEGKGGVCHLPGTA